MSFKESPRVYVATGLEDIAGEFVRRAEELEQRADSAKKRDKTRMIVEAAIWQEAADVLRATKLEGK